MYLGVFGLNQSKSVENQQLTLQGSRRPVLIGIKFFYINASTSGGDISCFHFSKYRIHKLPLYNSTDKYSSLFLLVLQLNPNSHFLNYLVGFIS